MLLRLRQARRWRETAATAWALGQPELSSAYGVEASRWLAQLALSKCWEDTGVRLAAASLVASVAGCIILGMGLSFGAWFSVFLLCVIALWPVYAALDDARFSFTRAVAVVALSRIGEPDTAHVVARATTDTLKGNQTLGSGLVRRAAAAALPSALRRLTDQHYGAVPAALPAALGAALNSGDRSVQLAALKGLAHVGRGVDAAAVRRFSSRAPEGEAREAAECTLAVLEERLRLEQDSQSLLRAGEAPRDDGLLLRMAGVPADQQQRLLTPAGEPGDTEEVGRA